MIASRSFSRFFSHLRRSCAFRTASSSSYPADWDALVTKELKGKRGPDSLEWHTPEGIVLKPVYTKHDVQNLDTMSGAEGGDLPGKM